MTRDPRPDLSATVRRQPKVSPKARLDEGEVDWSATIRRQSEVSPRARPSEREADWSATIRPHQPEPLSEGELFAGRYRVEDVIGEGGMGVVYRVRDEETGDRRALKTLHPDCLDNASLRKLARGEARTGWYLTQRGVHHPNIVCTVDFGTAPDQPNLAFFLMEYVDDGTLGQLVGAGRKYEPLEPDRAFSYVEQIAAGMIVAHKAGVIHRDIKPSNILVERNLKTVKITDFGISIWLDDAAMDSNSPQVMASIPWAAPEQLNPIHKEKEYTDICSLGKVLYFLLSGCSYEMVFYLPLAGRRHLPTSLDVLIRKTCAFNPQIRHQDMPAFLRDLQRVKRQYHELRAKDQQDVSVTQDNEQIETCAAWLGIGQDLAVGSLTKFLVPGDEREAHLLQKLVIRRLREALEACDFKQFNVALCLALNMNFLEPRDVSDWRSRFVEHRSHQAGLEGRYHDAIRMLQQLLRRPDMEQRKRVELRRRQGFWEGQAECFGIAARTRRDEPQRRVLATDGQRSSDRSPKSASRPLRNVPPAERTEPIEPAVDGGGSPLPGADLRELPVNEAAAVLRDWARVILAGHFGGEPARAFDEQRLLVLSQFVAAQPMADPQSLRLRGAIFGQLRFANAGQDLAPEELLVRIQDHLAEGEPGRISSHFGPYQPPGMWNLIAQRAWLDADFRLEVATRIHGYLREHYICLDFPVAALESNTFWVLAAAPLPAVQRAGRQPRRTDQLTQCRTLLQETGERLARHSSWAGFWDQWVIARILSDLLWNRAPLSKKVADLVIDFPILESPSFEKLRQWCHRQASKAQGPESTPEGAEKVADRPDSPVNPRWGRKMPPFLARALFKLPPRTTEAT